MSRDDGIILCQPDGRKGCSACCGLFNHRDLSEKNLDAYLGGGVERVGDRLFDGDYSSSFPVRDTTTHVCPFQGYLSPGRPGCLLHPLHTGEDMRDRSLFGSRICNAFLCPAHDILTRQEKELLISCTDRWYHYTIAVIDPESFQWMVRETGRLAGTGPGDPGYPSHILPELLALHGRYLEKPDACFFYYGLGEYNLARHGFSLASGNPALQREKDDIMAVMLHMLNG